MTLPRGVREAALAALAALAVVLTQDLPGGALAWRKLEVASLDLRFQMRGPIPARPDVVLVMADDASLARLGRWPLSRHLLARAVDRLDAAGARVIVFDQLFTEPDQPKPPNLRAIAGAAAAALPSGAPADLRQALTALAEDDPDADFAASIRRSGKVLLPFALVFDRNALAGAEADIDLGEAGYQSFDKSTGDLVPALIPRAARVPIAPLRAAAAGLGSVNIVYDIDSAPRYEYLVSAPFNGDYLPPIGVRAAAAALGVPWSQVAPALGRYLRIGDVTIPTDDPAMTMLVNYRGPRGTFATFSLADLLDGRIDPARLRDRVVILGASFVGNADANPSPFRETELPGAERMANVIATILDRDFIRALPPGLALEVEVGLLLLAALTGAVAVRLPTRSMAVIGVLPPIFWFAGARIAFGQGWWIPLANPIAALVLAAIVTVLFRYWVTDRERRQIKSTFRRYMAPKLVEYLAAHPDRVRLGGETRQVTLMFCDVRGFTTISEAYAADPQGLVRLINRFLTRMANIVHAQDGTIDKYIGDCIMAYWNAPLDDLRHAELACRSALAMLEALPALNRELAAEAHAAGTEFHEIRVGIGLNTGDCVLGNLGSADAIQSFSALGDPVNLAARFEGQTKTYGVDIVIGDTTQAAAPGFATLELDRIAVKGKTEAVRIHALLGGQAMLESAEFQALHSLHAGLLAAYRAQDWDGAARAVDRCAASAPALAELYALFRRRIAAYAAEPPGPDWDGVHVARSK